MQDGRARLEDLQDRTGESTATGATPITGWSWILLTRSVGGGRGPAGSARGSGASPAWIERQATEDGELPEQTAHHLQAPEYLEEWKLRWGAERLPVLWSHASYLSLRVASVRSQT